MELAKTAALRSEDPYRKVGACLMRADHTIAALGFNGAPAGVDLDWTDRDERRQWMLHAEANALRYVTPGEVKTVVTTSLPCAPCMLLIASYGIKEVYYMEELDPAVYDKALILEIASRSGISVERMDA
jgi:dCMP deaminase